MEDLSLYLGLALLSLLAVLTSWRRRSLAHGGNGLRLPPGPWNLPVVGSLHHIAGQLPHRAMREQARRHGPVMLLRVGEVPTVVLSSREAAREVLKTHDVAFASRPLSATTRVITNGGRDIIFTPYGDLWRQLRKIAMTELLSARRVLSFRRVREEEVAAILRAVATAASVSPRPVPVNISALMSALVSDATARTVFGDRCKERDLFVRQLSPISELAAGFNPADLWPASWLARRLSRAMRRAEVCRDTVFRILDGIIKEHLESMEEDRGGAGEAEDILHVLLKIHKDAELQIPLDMDVIKAVIFDIFAAGSETSAAALDWAMAELIRNPKAMEQATAEVRGAFGAHGTVPERALGELRYLQLVIRETFRLHPPLPLLLPRESRERTCRVLGYDVPQGTTVLVNAWALGRDERYWPMDPDEFRPERFADAGGGASAVDFKGADFELLPFGAGRRMCPGMGFALAMVELALASLLFHFDWEAPGMADPTKLDMSEAFGVTVRRKDDLLLRPILRVPVPGV
uniref:Cytochrome P450 n=1 Tax=Oryza brachyantha TaxID=4533 RepID=J3NCU7_ORYBR